MNPNNRRITIVKRCDTCQFPSVVDNVSRMLLKMGKMIPRIGKISFLCAFNIYGFPIIVDDVSWMRLWIAQLFDFEKVLLEVAIIMIIPQFIELW